MVKLNLCKCGETEPCVHVQMIYFIEADEEKYCVMCEECDCETGIYNTEEEAVAEWNGTHVTFSEALDELFMAIVEAGRLDKIVDRLNKYLSEGHKQDG